MTKLWALACEGNDAVFTYGGRALVHENKAEMEYLFPSGRVVPLPAYWGQDLTFPLKDHPDMDTVVFPLAQNMDQFRVPRRK